MYSDAPAPKRPFPGVFWTVMGDCTNAEDADVHGAANGHYRPSL